MEQSPNIVEQIISNLNQRYGLTVRLGIVEDSRLLPMANKATMTIRCNYRLLLMFQLYHMGNADLLVKYFLTHKFMSYHLYDDAKHWMEQTEATAAQVMGGGGIVSMLSSIRDIFRNTSNGIHVSQDEIRLFQLLFVVLHEYSHCAFYQRDDLKKEYFDWVREINSEVQHHMSAAKPSDNIPWWMKLLSMNQMGRDFIGHVLDLNEATVSDDRKTEEFACDLHAWRVLATVLHHGGYSVDEQILIFTAMVEALYCLENYKLLDDCLSRKIDMSKAESTSVFDSMRYAWLTHAIVMYLEGCQKGKGLEFDRQFSLLRWNERKDYIHLIVKYVPLTADLEKGAQLPDKKVADDLYLKISQMENKLIDD